MEAQNHKKTLDIVFDDIRKEKIVFDEIVVDRWTEQKADQVSTTASDTSKIA